MAEHTTTEAPAPATRTLRRGRIVHHVSRRAAADADCEVAIVTRLGAVAGVVDLTTWADGDWQQIRGAEHGSSPGHWHWPDACPKGL